ncbi:antitoxin Xre-like helix-turn-helix domain-containing protein [Hymenobacter terrenus]|uniref:antitoxin Xre-like helix-turn-helix domain-containing protein n=1 Tax=Hymenobacter terrenus TaxID=1629124 RepID=UPI00061907FE|nr:hypothetical protein [Hymenobacter terrenus]
MPRSAFPSTRLPARVRAWFGLTQAELAMFLRVSPATAQHAESGRYRLTAAVHEALQPLAHHLPPPNALPEADPALPPPDAAELAYRRLQCGGQSRRLQRELDRLEAQARYGARWATAAPALLAASPTGSDPAAVRERAWLQAWLAHRARPLTAAEAARVQLLRARLVGLAAELAALAEG